jgi:hypothetical protein
MKRTVNKQNRTSGGHRSQPASLRFVIPKVVRVSITSIVTVLIVVVAALFVKSPRTVWGQRVTRQAINR